MAQFKIVKTPRFGSATGNGTRFFRLGETVEIADGVRPDVDGDYALISAVDGAKHYLHSSCVEAVAAAPAAPTGFTLETVKAALGVAGVGWEKEKRTLDVLRLIEKGV